MHRMITMHARLRQTDGCMDEHDGNSTTVCSMNALRTKNCE